MMNTAAYPAYESYKDSNIEWLGNVPHGWKTIKLKFLTRIVKRIVGREGPDVLSITQNGIKIKDVTSGKGQIAENYSNYQLVNRGDFAMNHMDLLTGYVGISNFDGVVSPDYRVFRRTSDELDDRYLLLILQIGYKQRIFFRYGQGVSLLGRWRFPAENFKEFQIPIPPLREQRAIAAVLEKKCAWVDEAMRIKEEQILLLRERQQILIQQAVTRGLNSASPMRDSGVDWIGQIPAHWGVENPKRIFNHRKERARKGEPQLAATQKYGVIPQVKFMDLEGRRITQVLLDFDILKHVEAGDFVISMRSFQGGLEYSEYTGSVSSAYVAIEPGPRIYAPFYKYIFKSARYIEALQATSNLVRDGQALRFDNFAMVTLPIFPVHEQREIADYLDVALAKSGQGIAIKEEQIATLKEYKTTLINAAVTGKIKVA